MSAAPDAVMREWFQEVWNHRRGDTIDRLMARKRRFTVWPPNPSSARRLDAVRLEQGGE